MLWMMMLRVRIFDYRGLYKSVCCPHDTLVIIMTDSSHHYDTTDCGRLVTGDDDGYIVFWDMAKCLDPEAGPDTLSYRSHNTYVEVRRR